MRVERHLAHLLEQCNKFSTSLTTVDPVIKEALFDLIKWKIRGEALDLIVANCQQLGSHVKIF